MIDPTIIASLTAVRDGEITDAPRVRPILCDASRALDALFEEVFDARALLSEAKNAFAMGWEPEFMGTEEDDA